MSNIVSNIFSVKELRDRIFFTLFIMVVFRIGAQISVPGINPSVLYDMSQSGVGAGGFFDLLNLFSGGAMSQFSLFALGIMPYISSSIIMQLLKVVVPSLDRLSKEGSYGQKKVELYTKYGTLALCVVQAVGLMMLFETTYLSESSLRQANVTAEQLIGAKQISLWFKFTFILTMTTGTMFLLWLGERITERGIGNGVSLIIFAGIVARFPLSVYQLFTSNAQQDVIMILVVIVIFLIVMGLVVAEQMATRKIPVQYAKRVVGNKMFGAQSTHIPFKINPSGVIPIIFASSVIIFPAQLMQIFSSAFTKIVNGKVVTTDFGQWLSAISNSLAPGQWAYIIFYMLLVIFFAYFYTAIYFNPVEIADRLKKEGGFIPGIRPGSNTSSYLSKVLNRITLPGSIFLGLVAVFPDLIVRVESLKNIPSGFKYLMGGTSLLIMVGVGLDLAKQIESHLLTRNMSGFMKKTKIKGRR